MAREALRGGRLPGEWALHRWMLQNGFAYLRDPIVLGTKPISVALVTRSVSR